MSEQNSRLDQLQERLELLLRQQDTFYSEIKNIQLELSTLKNESSIQGSTSAPVPEMEKQKSPVQVNKPIPPKISVKKETSGFIKGIKSRNLEKFIAENLISIIGIVIIVVGVGIGAKLAIERNLIGPEVRITLGYLFGLGLTLTAILLRKKYEGFSAIILSGAMAIMYLITFVAYNVFHLFPQELTFVLLVFFTIFTVVASLYYNRQIIAHIGLVGAYCVPWLLSDNSGRISIMFSYMTIINAGILFIALKRYWKPLSIVAFSVTWLIYLIWYFNDYMYETHFGLAFTFLIIFFLIFFLTFLLYKIVNKGKFGAADVLLFISNSFVFFGIGYAILSYNDSTSQYLGLFTLATALLHFLISLPIYFNKLIDKGLYYLMAGLVLIFITIAFPVQLDGNWVTMLWGGEAALLFWIGRSNKIKLYEYLSYPLFLLTFFSIIHDWSKAYEISQLNSADYSGGMLWNINFLSSAFVIACFSITAYFDNLKKHRTPEIETSILRKIMSTVIPLLLIFTAYFAIVLEIGAHWDKLFYQTGIKIPESTMNEYEYFEYNTDLMLFRSIWIINFTLLFVSVISYVVIQLKRPAIYTWIMQSVNLVILLVFLFGSLLKLSDLRESYLMNEQSGYFQQSIYHIYIRYISLLFAAGLLLSMYRLFIYMNSKPKKIFALIISGAILWILSSELLHWLDIFDSTNSYKLALSIFFGVYALCMVIYGIWKDAKHIRLSAFILIGITLLKLFFYDLSDMAPISRALILIILGLLMLGVSFLYIKFKNKIFGETPKDNSPSL